MPNQIISGLDFAEYLRLDRVSKSALDMLHKSPAHYKLSRDGRLDRPKSEAMQIGTVVDHLVFPGRDKSPFVVVPATYKDAKGTEQPWNNRVGFCREWRDTAERDGLVALDYKEHIRCIKMAGEVLNDPRVKELIATGEAQPSVLWSDRGHNIKARPDWLTPRFACDLKCTADVSNEAISRSIATYRWHVQAALYTDGIIANGRECNAFYLICVQSEPPHFVNVKPIALEAIELGRMEYRRGLDLLTECEESGEWPGPGGNDGDGATFDLPGWYYNKQDTDNIKWD